MSGEKKVVIIAGERATAMTKPFESKLDNADMQAAPRALLRAARRAREIARQTNTGIVIVQDGKMVVLTGDELDDLDREDD